MLRESAEGLSLRVEPMTLRTSLKSTCMGVAIALIANAIGAEEPAVPVGLQVELTAKIAGYDRNYAPRAGARAKVFIVSKPGDAESTKVANQARAAFGGLAEIGGVAHEEIAMSFAGAKGLADEVTKQKPALIYISSGLSNDVAAIADALNGKDVVTIAAIAGDVSKGAVLGFDLVSGKPKLLVHLTQAKKQNAAFKAEALKLMKVFE